MNAAERRATYLDDLGQLLQPLSAVDRIGVIDGVRDRIDRAVARLGHDPTDGEMSGILAGIGSVQDLAQDALKTKPTTARAPSPAPVTATVVSRPTERPPTADADGATDAPSSSRPASGPGGRYDLSDIPAMDWPDEPAPRPGLTKRWVPLVVAALIFLGGFFLMFLLPALVLIVGVLFLWVSPLWSTSEKAIGTAVPTLGLGAFLPLLVAGSGPDGRPLLLLVGVIGFAAGIAGVVWLARRGLIASRALDLQSPLPARKR